MDSPAYWKQCPLAKCREGVACARPNDCKSRVPEVIVVMGPLTCHDCGALYSGLGCDLVLPDQQWKALFPEDGGILCANCICQRARRLGATALLAWLDNLDYVKSVHTDCGGFAAPQHSNAAPTKEK